METTKIISLAQLHNLANLVIKAAENVRTEAKKIDIQGIYENKEDLSLDDAHYLKTLELITAYQYSIDKLHAHTKAYFIKIPKKRRFEVYELLLQSVERTNDLKDAFDCDMDINHSTGCVLYVFNDIMKMIQQHVKASITGVFESIEWCKAFDYKMEWERKKMAYIDNNGIVPERKKSK